MTTTTPSKPYEWLRVIEPELVKLQDTTVIGGPDAFSWERLTSSLSELLEIPDLAIHPTTSTWQTDKELATYIGRHPWLLNVSLSAVTGSAAWVMADKDVAILMAALLTKKGDPLDHSDKEFQTGFFRFLGTVLTNALYDLGFQGDYAISLLDSNEAPKGPGLCLEIDISLCNTTVKGRLVATEELVEAWKKRFTSSSSQARLLSPAAQSLEVVLHLEAGKVTLKTSQLKTVRVGDVILLDSCTVLPDEERGRVMMTLNGVPVFRGMLKQNKIKVLEYPLYHKVDTPMSKEEEGFEEEAELEEDAELEEETESDLGEEEEEGAVDKMQPAPAIGERTRDIPITVVVEVGRIQMKLEKLMQMQPGQLLELETNPEEGVDLVVNGRCIAKGELLKIGEALGIRILELSS